MDVSLHSYFCLGLNLSSAHGAINAAWFVTWSVFRSFKQVVEEDPDCSTQNPMFSMLEQPGIGSYLAPGLPMEFGALHPAAAPRFDPWRAHR